MALELLEGVDLQRAIEAGIRPDPKVDAAHRAAAARRPRPRPRARDRPPRREAVEPLPAPRAGRRRSWTSAWRASGGGHDHRGLVVGHAQLHVARAGARRAPSTAAATSSRPGSSSTSWSRARRPTRATPSSPCSTRSPTRSPTSPHPARDRSGSGCAACSSARSPRTPDERYPDAARHGGRPRPAPSRSWAARSDWTRGRRPGADGAGRDTAAPSARARLGVRAARARRGAPAAGGPAAASAASGAPSRLPAAPRRARCGRGRGRRAPGAWPWLAMRRAVRPSPVPPPAVRRPRHRPSPRAGAASLRARRRPRPRRAAAPAPSLRGAPPRRRRRPRAPPSRAPEAPAPPGRPPAERAARPRPNDYLEKGRYAAALAEARAVLRRGTRTTPKRASTRRGRGGGDRRSRTASSRRGRRSRRATGKWRWRRCSAGLAVNRARRRLLALHARPRSEPRWLLATDARRFALRCAAPRGSARGSPRRIRS